jgi:hypothetical protein
MFYVALTLVLATPISIMAWLYLRLDLQLRAEDKMCARRLERFGNAVSAAFIDLVDDRPFGIKGPRLDAFRSEPINRRW